MRKPKLSVKVEAASPKRGIPLGEFAQTLTRVRSCLRLIVKKTEARHHRFEVADLKTGSAIVTITDQATSNGVNVIGVFKDVIRSIKTPNRFPSPLDLSYSEIERFRSIANPVYSGALRIWVSNIELTRRFIDNADKMLALPISTESDIKGIVEKINVHRTREFVLFTAATQDAVTCAFEEDLMDSVRSSLKRSVVVRGKLHYRSGQIRPSKVTATSIQLLRDAESLPKLSAMKGTWSGSTGKLDSVQFVRKARESF